MMMKTLRSSRSNPKIEIRKNRMTNGTALALMMKISRNSLMTVPDMTGNVNRENSIPCSGSAVSARCGGR